jgi:CheY-like chemotaxis protein
MNERATIILLADDDTDDVELFCEALHNVDPKIKCYVAENGLVAMNILRSPDHERPSLIFLDINMPKMNGWQCLKAIKDDRDLQGIPVFIYSTSTLQEDLELALKLGAIGLFTKPEKFAELECILKLIMNDIDKDLRDILKDCAGVRFTI